MELGYVMCFADFSAKTIVFTTETVEFPYMRIRHNLISIMQSSLNLFYNVVFPTPFLGCESIGNL